MIAFGTDFDGVIINIEPQKAQAFGEVLHTHWGISIQEAANFWIAKGGTSRRYKFDYLYNKQFHKQLSEKHYNSVEQEYSHLLKTKYYPHVTMEPGARELLEFVKSTYDFTFVSSGVPQEEITYLVRLNEASQYFDVVLGTNRKYTSKRDHFKKVIAEQNPETIIFIADSPEDMVIAKGFPKTKAIGVPTNHTAHELKKAGADLVSDNLTSLLNILKV